MLRDVPELKTPEPSCAACARRSGRSDCPPVAIAARWSSRSSKHHIAESWPHLRVEECRTCRVYLKAVDLRLDGSAQSLVDELASVELGLWAHERGA